MQFLSNLQKIRKNNSILFIKGIYNLILYIVLNKPPISHIKASAAEIFVEFFAMQISFICWISINTSIETLINPINSKNPVFSKPTKIKISKIEKNKNNINL